MVTSASRSSQGVPRGYTGKGMFVCFPRNKDTGWVPGLLAPASAFQPVQRGPPSKAVRPHSEVRNQLMFPPPPLHPAPISEHSSVLLRIATLLAVVDSLVADEWSSLLGTHGCCCHWCHLALEALYGIMCNICLGSTSVSLLVRPTGLGRKHVSIFKKF